MALLEGKHALVVGGSGGIGRALSLSLASPGARLCIHGGHDGNKLESTAHDARELGAEVTTHLEALSGPEQAANLLEAAGQVDVLVVAFGPWLEAPIAGMGVSEWSRMVSLNLTLPGVLASMVLPGMAERNWGRIVFFGGPRSDRLEGYRRIGAYAGAKAGLASLTRSIALQYAASNIRCNMICPGYVDTEYYSDSQRARARAGSPAGRLVTVGEIASLARYLLSDEADAINGAIIPVDFGF
jgi:NAD(P)-dependent dehydrogenase (short-subunit alcohol dehydrogenase family)